VPPEMKGKQKPFETVFAIGKSIPKTINIQGFARIVWGLTRLVEGCNHQTFELNFGVG